MKERIQELEDLLAETKRYPEDKMLFLEKQLDLISDLVHKVEQFEPEEITEEDVVSLGYPTTTSLLQKAVERDKLAQELVESILGNEWITSSNFSTILHLANQLKEKLYAPTK